MRCGVKEGALRRQEGYYSHALLGDQHPSDRLACRPARPLQLACSGCLLGATIKVWPLLSKACTGAAPGLPRRGSGACARSRSHVCTGDWSSSRTQMSRKSQLSFVVISMTHNMASKGLCIFIHYRGTFSSKGMLHAWTQTHLCGRARHQSCWFRISSKAVQTHIIQVTYN